MKEAKTKKLRKRIKIGKINKKAALIFLIVLFAAAAVIWAVYVALVKQESTGIADGAYYYAVDEKETLPSGSVLKRQDDITRVENRGHEYSLTGSMIFEDGGSTLLFQDDMLWYDRAQDSMKRLSYFTRMTRDGGYVFTRGHSEKSVSDGFLYDNGDLYVILENASLTYGEQTLEIAAPAVISCTWNGDVQLITPDGACAYIEQPGQSLAVNFSDGCVLNPLVDTYYQANGTWRLLFTSVSMVPEL